MANKAMTVVIRGRLDWAKVLGKARPHTGDPKFDKGPAWSVDVTPDAAGIEKLKTLLSKKHFAEKMREPKGNDKRKEEFLTFRHYLNGKDGDTNEPISVKDASGNEWPQNRMLGNGTIADVKFRMVDYGTTVGMYIQAIRVLKLVPYDQEEFAPLSEDDEFFADSETVVEGDEPAGDPVVQKWADDDMEDDVPY